ncbi:unnamed protein product [Effrenium voratum]|nr:unnamed protein product [Effrenium voratum]
MFETADDFVEVMAKEEAAKVAQRVRAEGVGEQPLPDVSVQTKSMCLQSFTMTELFYKCSADFPQVEIHGGCNKKEKAALRLWFGQAFNLDEAYEFLESLSLLGSRGDKAKDSSVNAHASTLNTLLARGKTKRATRTSTSYEASRTQRVSLSFLGNGHPGKLIPMERNLEGQHTAATKERFLLCVDVSVPRHESLSPDMLAADDSLPAWTWLPLTPLQAAIFGWTGILNNPGHFEGQEPGLENIEEGDEGFPAVLPNGVRSRIRYVYDSAPAPAGPSVAVRTEWRISGRWQVRDQTEHIQAGARRVCEYFAKRPHKTLELTDGAQKLLVGNQVAQSIRATNKDGQASMEALHANAAHQEGMMSAAVAILELAAGGGSFDESGQLQVTEDHVQVASRLVELSLQIREVLRGPVDAATAESSESDGGLFKPVEVPAPQRRFAPPAATQLPTVAQPRAEEPLQHDEHVPVPLPESWSLQVADQPEEAEPPQPLRPSDLQPAEAFFATGFGENGAMILPGKMQDRAFMSKLLLAGRSEVTLSKAVDVYHLLEVQGSKRRKIRPPQAKLLQVCQKAFSLFPRLGQVNVTKRGSETTVLLRGWSASTTNQLLFHNEAMRCCRVSIREIAKRRALWHDRSAGRGEHGDEAPEEEAAADDAAAEAPQPATPPTGRR